MQGRFTSVDPQNAGGDSSYPQSWNGYAYAHNNPLRYVDPDGLDIRTTFNGGGGRWYTEKEFDKYKRDLAAEGFVVKGGKIIAPVYDDDNNVIGGRVIGTYSSDMSDFGQGVSAELARRNPAMQQFGKAGVAYLGLFALPASQGTLMVGWLGRGLTSAEAAAPVGPAALTGLIEAAGQLTPVAKGGGAQLQGWVRGSAQQIFEVITRGATRLPNGSYKLADGTRVFLYNSSKTGVATIHIHTAEKIISMRIMP